MDNHGTDSVTGMPRLTLGAEGAALMLAAASLYAASSSGWWLFAALFFLPDLAIPA